MADLEAMAEKAYRRDLGYDDEQGVDTRDLSWFTAGYKAHATEDAALIERLRRVVKAGLGAPPRQHVNTVDLVDAALANLQPGDLG